MLSRPGLFRHCCGLLQEVYVEGIVRGNVFADDVKVSRVYLSVGPSFAVVLPRRCLLLKFVRTVW